MSGILLNTIAIHGTDLLPVPRQIGGGFSRSFLRDQMISSILHGTTIHADENSAYGALKDDYEVQQINHSAEEYERDGVHTNSIESLWAVVKRVYIGIHHHWSEKHMQKYLDACVFRVNRKETGTLERIDDLLNMAMGARLTYKQLIA